MAYNFTPLKYSPYKYGSAPVYRDEYDERTGQTYQVPTGASQDTRSAGERSFQDYSGGQFKSLFDAVNALGKNPYMSGAPQYSPYQGTRSDFTTGGEQAPTVFDQQAYLDARFGNINDYLGKMGSFFSSMGSPTGQQILANAPAQGPRPPMPSIGSNLNIGGGTNINNPFQSFGEGTGGGWGTPPTSLFGAGANATNT